MLDPPTTFHALSHLNLSPTVLKRWDHLFISPFHRWDRGSERSQVTCPRAHKKGELGWPSRCAWWSASWKRMWDLCLKTDTHSKTGHLSWRPHKQLLLSRSVTAHCMMGLQRQWGSFLLSDGLLLPSGSVYFYLKESWPGWPGWAMLLVWASCHGPASQNGNNLIHFFSWSKWKFLCLTSLWFLCVLCPYVTYTHGLCLFS